MTFFCDKCQAEYSIADDKVGDHGVKVKCKNCEHLISVQAPQSDASAGAMENDTVFADEDINGAFDQLLTGGDAGGEPALGSMAELGVYGSELVASAVLDANDVEIAPAAPAVDKNWYVAVNDAQVGPVERGDLEKRWERREINAETLVWKAGMNDWLPISDVAELADLVANSPHPAATAKIVVPSVAPVPLQNTHKRADGIGKSAAALADDIDWRPSAASALSSLVQEEMESSSKQRESTAKQANVSQDLGLPGFAAGDLFSTSQNATPDLAAVAASNTDQWSLPNRRQESKGKLFAVVGVALVLVAGGAGAVVWMSQNKTPPPAPVVAAVQPAVPTPPVQPVAAVPTPTPAAEDPALVAPTSAPEDAAKAESEAKKNAKLLAKKKAAAAMPAKASAAAAATGAPAARRDAIDDVFDSSGLPAKRTREDIFSGIKSNAASVAPCVENAQRNNELAPGQYKFILDWTIRPNGTVVNAVLKGPPNVLSGTLPACFASVMSSWRFAPSQEETPIKNFPFGPVNVH